MFDEQLRERKEALFLNVALNLRLNRVHPLALSAIALLFGVAAAMALWQQAYALGFVLWFCNRLFDGLDGTVARVQDLQSDLGGYVDILTDFAIYAAIPIALVLAAPTTAAFVALAFLLATFYVNAASWMYLSAILEKRRQLNRSKKTTIAMPTGLIGGAETIVFYSLFMFWPAAIVPLFALMGGLVLVTVLQRLAWALQHLD